MGKDYHFWPLEEEGWEVALSQFGSHLGADQVEEEDEVEQALDKDGGIVQGRKDPQIVDDDQKDCAKSHGPGPAEEHQQARGGGDEAGGYDEKERRVNVAGNHSEDNDAGEQQQVKADGGEAGEREKAAARWLIRIHFVFMAPFEWIAC